MNPFESNPVLLTGTSLHYQISDTVLLDSQDILLREGERVALVGRNGSGKSSLMRILSGREQFFTGEITRKKGLRVQYLPQEVELRAGLTIREAILEGAADLLDLLREYEHCEGPRQAELEHQISIRGGWDLENRLETLLDKFRIPAQERLVETLSGGEKRRVGLAKVFLDMPDLLMLDEPTNHLDQETMEYLEETIARSGKSYLVVTHDRAFLNRTATRILELSFGKLYSYDGNYEDFLRKKAERITDEEAAENRRLSFLRREMEWIRRGPKARTTKSQARVDRFWEIANQEPLKREQTAELLLPPAPPLGNIIVQLKDLGYQVEGRWLFRHLNLEFTRGMRLGVVGRNGLGKTTLLRLILGELTPTEGSVRVGEKVRFNYAEQHRVQLHDEKTVFEEVGEGNDFVLFDDRKLNLWGYLRNYLFQDEEIHSQVGKLSGGERNRVVLAVILKRGGNFMLLDEPTNDLDLPTLRVLEESLNAFEGCLAVVSHDRYFLNRVCTHILAFEEDGTLTFLPGDYSYYAERRRERQAEARKDERRTAPVETRPRNTRTAPKLTWAEKKELEGMEERIAQAESEVAEIEGIFQRPDYHEKFGTRTAELSANLAAAKEKVAQLYERWEELERKKEESV